MEGSDGWIPEWVIEVGDRIFAVAGFVLTGLAGLLYRNYRDHVAMLTRHDDELRESAKELGLQRSHRELVAKGPIGESLVREIEELRAADNLLHRRISRRQRELTELKDAVIEMRTDIKWMRQRWEERENDATTH